MPWPPTPYLPLGRELRAAREATGELQKDVAARVGVTPGTFCRWELGQELPMSRYVRALARELGIDPLRILELAEREQVAS